MFVFKMDMSPKEIERFLELVSVQPALYNPKDMSFRDQLLRDTIWAAIGQEMNRSSEFCKKCWRNLKDAYTRFRRRYKETGGQIDKRTNYGTYKLMSFLEDIEEHRYRRKMQRTTTTSDDVPKVKHFSSDNPIVLGVEHIMFNKPIQVLRQTNNKNKKVIKVVKAKPSTGKTIDSKSVAVEKMTIPDMPETNNKNNKVIKVVKANPTTSKSIDSKSVLIEKLLIPDMPDVEHTEGVKVIPVSSDIALKRRRLDESSVDQIRVTSVVSANNCNDNDASQKEIDEDKTLMYFTTHVREVLKKLPPLLQIQAKQEMFRALTKYELMALESSNAGSCAKCADTLRAEKREESGSELTDENVKEESNIYDDVIQIKEEGVENDLITSKYDYTLEIIS